ncbi:MAG: hypothetical protein Q9193_006225 [Seirophora villosa]
MVGKRKREVLADTKPRKKPGIQLTRSNLQLFVNRSREAFFSASPFPPPFHFIMSQAPQTPEASKKSQSASKAWSSVSKAEEILDTYRIYLDRCEPLPADLQKLIDAVLVPRDEDITPNSKFVQGCRTVIRTMDEDTALHTLADRITYKARMFQADLEGEPLIWRARSNQWNDTVPKPVAEEGSYALENAMEAHGCPPKPKPDMSFGYNDDAFDHTLLLARKALPKDFVVYAKKPWFPYMVKEWKSSLESPAKAQQQARRDAAAAVDTTYRFFKHVYPDTEPSAALTCVFSICVNQQGFEYRVHWRHVEENGRVSWEGDPVACAYYNDAKQVFHARSAILNTLVWVRGARLTAIRDALKVMVTRHPPTLTSVPSQNRPLTPPVSTARAALSPAAGSPVHKRQRRLLPHEDEDDTDELA